MLILLKIQSPTKRRCHLSERKLITIPSPPSDHPLAWFDQVCTYDLEIEGVKADHLPEQAALPSWSKQHAFRFRAIITQWSLSDIWVPKVLNPETDNKTMPTTDSPFVAAWKARVTAAHTACQLSLWKLSGIEAHYKREPNIISYGDALIPLERVSFCVEGLTEVETDTACELIYLLNGFLSYIYPKCLLTNEQISIELEEISMVGSPNVHRRVLSYQNYMNENIYNSGQFEPLRNFDKQPELKNTIVNTGGRISGSNGGKANIRNRYAKIVKRGLETYLSARPELFNKYTYKDLQTHLTTSCEVLEAIPLIEEFTTTSTMSGTWLPEIEKIITFRGQLSSFLTTHPEWFVNYPEFSELQKRLCLSPEVNLAVPLLIEFQGEDDKKRMIDEWLPAIKEKINNSFKG